MRILFPSLLSGLLALPATAQDCGSFLLPIFTLEKQLEEVDRAIDLAVDFAVASDGSMSAAIAATNTFAELEGNTAALREQLLRVCAGWNDAGD